MSTDLNPEFERKRRKVIDELRATLSSSTISSEEKRLFESTIKALEELTEGVDAAHRRILARKQEMLALNHKMTELASAIRDIIDAMDDMESNISKKIDAQNRSNRRFYIGMSLASAVIIGFMAYIAFGSKEAITSLGTLTQALKLLDIII